MTKRCSIRDPEGNIVVRWESLLDSPVDRAVGGTDGSQLPTFTPELVPTLGKITLGRGVGIQNLPDFILLESLTITADSEFEIPSYTTLPQLKKLRVGKECVIDGRQFPNLEYLECTADCWIVYFPPYLKEFHWQVLQEQPNTLPEFPKSLEKFVFASIVPEMMVPFFDVAHAEITGVNLCFQGWGDSVRILNLCDGAASGYFDERRLNGVNIAGIEVLTIASKVKSLDFLQEMKALTVLTLTLDRSVYLQERVYLDNLKGTSVALEIDFN